MTMLFDLFCTPDYPEFAYALEQEIIRYTMHGCAHSGLQLTLEKSRARPVSNNNSEPWPDARWGLIQAV